MAVYAQVSSTRRAGDTVGRRWHLEPRCLGFERGLYAYEENIVLNAGKEAITLMSLGGDLRKPTKI